MPSATDSFGHNSPGENSLVDFDDHAEPSTLVSSVSRHDGDQRLSDALQSDSPHLDYPLQMYVKSQTRLRKRRTPGRVVTQQNVNSPLSTRCDQRKCSTSLQTPHPSLLESMAISYTALNYTPIDNPRINLNVLPAYATYSQLKCALVLAARTHNALFMSCFTLVLRLQFLLSSSAPS